MSFQKDKRWLIQVLVGMVKVWYALTTSPKHVKYYVSFAREQQARHYFRLAHNATMVNLRGRHFWSNTTFYIIIRKSGLFSQKLS